MCEYCEPSKEYNFFFEFDDLAIGHYYKDDKFYAHHRPDLEIVHDKVNGKYFFSMTTDQGLWMKEITTCPFCRRALDEEITDPTQDTTKTD